MDPRGLTEAGFTEFELCDQGQLRGLVLDVISEAELVCWSSFIALEEVWVGLGQGDGFGPY